MTTVAWRSRVCLRGGVETLCLAPIMREFVVWYRQDLFVVCKLLAVVCGT